MIRSIRKEDHDLYLSMAKAFYESDAVLSPVPEENLKKTFDLLLTDNIFK